MEYLDFELPVKELQEQIAKCQAIGDESSVDVTETCKLLKEKLDGTKKTIYGNLTAWQRVQMSRHPSRPYALDYINALCGNSFLELHGDRNFGDDKAMVGGLGKIDNQTFMFVGTQKGYNTKTRQYRNFGMAKPEGYRKALRLMKTAEKFGIPIISLIDTPGAYPGLEAEERGQGQAIANNIYQMLNYMLENTWYSVISPESCSSILWRSWEHKETAAEALKLTSDDMLNSKLIDKIIKEPLGGAHYDREKVFQTVKKQMIDAFRTLDKINSDQLIETRREKFSNMGTFQG
jgi:acetyl-CoA carboxylase carboxyl transferase subunit alpha